MISSEHEKTMDALCSVPLNQVAYKYQSSPCPEKVHPVGLVLMILFMTGEKSSNCNIHPSSKGPTGVSQTGNVSEGVGLTFLRGGRTEQAGGWVINPQPLVKDGRSAILAT